MDFLITVLAIIAGYYVLKYVFRLLAPRMMGYAAKKTEEHLKKKFEQFAEQQNTGNTNKNSTKNTTTNKKDLKSNPTKKVGEYIDFEEIE